MTTITRTVITVETTPGLLRCGRTVIHEALLDGDEDLAVGARVLIHDGEHTYRSAQVTGHDGELWELTLTRTD